MKLKSIAEKYNLEIFGNPDSEVYLLASPNEQRSNTLVVIYDEKYVPDVVKEASFIVERRIFEKFREKFEKRNCLIGENIDKLLPELIVLFAPVSEDRYGIDPTAIIDSSAIVEDMVYIGPYVVIEEGAFVGSGSVLYPFVYVGRKSYVGRRCVLYPNVVVYQNVRIKDCTVIHANSVIGADGFGFVEESESELRKVPHIGSVQIGSDVEVGALTAIDRAKLGSTIVGDGTKIDNLVQIGHNVKVGKRCIICGQAGLAGSSELGDRVVLGGQTGVGDHKKITSDVRVAAKSAVLSDIRKKGSYAGIPAIELEVWKRVAVLLKKLPTIFKRGRKNGNS